MAADRPDVGKWKVDLTRSDCGQTTITIESLSVGEWQPTAFALKAVGAKTWEMVAKADGKV